ncbi:MAG: hypothetical protein HKN82_20350 [Akkermansiaceae bacterium]|nr:hypothetical protein [Akkermansiaceae bacterium]NNM28170.1 hypothetical protein [Akkermansiaceae bacterium]
MKLLVLVLVAALLPVAASAERISEKREDATHEITGRVVAVKKDWGGEYTTFVVKVRIETIKKGDGFKPGDVMEVSCFKRNRRIFLTPGASGHGDPPKKGARIRAFVNRSPRKTEGVYPDWFDVLEDKKDAP